MATAIRPDAVHSLFGIASSKVIVMLWTQIKSSQLMSCDEFVGQWQQIADGIKKKVSLLQLPNKIEDKLICLVEPIGLQILEWFKYHKCIDIAFIENFCWIPKGVLDWEQTAEVIVKNDGIDVTDRYQMACHYCLQKYIPVLLNNMHETGRSFSNLESDMLSMFWKFQIEGNAIAVIQVIQAKISHSEYIPYHFAFPFYEPSHYTFAFLYAVENYNVAATRYFWTKVSEGEETDKIKTSIHKVAAKMLVKKCSKRSSLSDLWECRFGEVLHFLLSCMDEEEKTEVYQSNPIGVVSCFAHWHLRDNLFQVLERLGDILLVKDSCSLVLMYCFLLRVLVLKESSDSKNCVYKKFFTEIWQQMSKQVKEVVVRTCLNKDLLLLLCEKKDERNLKLILGEVPEEVKKHIFVSSQGAKICELLVDVDDMRLLEIFITKCVTSKDDVKKLTRNFWIWTFSDNTVECIEKIVSIAKETTHSSSRNK